MSLPKEQLEQIINDLNSLNSEELEQVVILIKDFKAKNTLKTKEKPSDFRGIWSHIEINVEEECRKMREEWDRNIL